MQIENDNDNTDEDEAEGDYFCNTIPASELINTPLTCHWDIRLAGNITVATKALVILMCVA